MGKQKLTTRQKESKKITRQRKLRKWWHTVAQQVGFAFSLALIITAAISLWWFSHSGKLAQMTANIQTRFWQKTASAGFKVENIYLEGRKFAALEDVTRAIHVQNGDPILALDLSDMRARLETVPRVKFAEVARVLPNQLHIHVIEREPVAVWQNQGRLHLIDQDGVVMEYVDPKDYQQLLLVVGSDAPAHTEELLKILALEPTLYKDIASAVRVGERRWNIHFNNGIELKLPEQKADEAWRNFTEMERDHHVLERAIASVDMRLSDRIFIKTLPLLKYQEEKELKKQG